MAPRATWKGTLNLAQMNCAVKLYAATSESGRISFNQLHRTTHRRISMKPVDAILGAVEREDLVRGYEYEDGRYVIVDDADLEPLKPEATHAIDIESFVEVAAVAAPYYDTPYFLVPDGAAAEEAYGLLHAVLKGTEKLAIARVVLASRERVVAISAIAGGLLARTLRASSEVRDPDEYFGSAICDNSDPKLLKLVDKLVAQKTTRFEPSRYEDRYEIALRGMIEEKRKVQVPVIAAPPGDENVMDLKSALKGSLSKRQTAGAATM